MRIVDSQQSPHQQVQKLHKRTKALKLVAVIVVIILALFIILGRAPSESNELSPAPTATSDTNVVTTEDLPVTVDPPVVEPVQKTLRIFTDNEFKVFYDQLLQPDLVRVANPPEISGDVLADTRIRSIAEARGYKLRSSPSVELVSVDGYLLHESVAQPWFELKAAAAAQGYSMSIVSGYRSVASQRQIYLSRLAATGATIAQVAAGAADAQVNEVLITSSIPGYSKHHTGYTIDLACNGFVFESFKDSPCNAWLIADNYKVAKEHGFIPSYPEGADNQGPDPEAWEYVYVSTELLYE